MAFNIVKNITMPVTVATRNRSRGDFASALDSLDVGDGFEFPSASSLKHMYPRVAPKKFEGKSFQVKLLTAAEDRTDEGAVEGENLFIVKRMK